MSDPGGGSSFSAHERRRAAQLYRLLVLAGILATMVVIVVIAWKVSTWTLRGRSEIMGWSYVVALLLGGAHALSHREEPLFKIPSLAALEPGDVRLPKWIGVVMIVAGLALAVARVL